MRDAVGFVDVVMLEMGMALMMMMLMMDMMMRMRMMRKMMTVDGLCCFC